LFSIWTDSPRRNLAAPTTIRPSGDGDIRCLTPRSSRPPPAGSPAGGAVSTPDRVNSRIDPSTFRDGAPSQATLDKVYDNLDYRRAFEAFVNTMQGVNALAAERDRAGQVSRAG
jgi:hypothetical protein